MFPRDPNADLSQPADYPRRFVASRDIADDWDGECRQIAEHANAIIGCVNRDPFGEYAPRTVFVRRVEYRARRGGGEVDIELDIYEQPAKHVTADFGPLGFDDWEITEHRVSP